MNSHCELISQERAILPSTILHPSGFHELFHTGTESVSVDRVDDERLSEQVWYTWILAMCVLSHSTSCCEIEVSISNDTKATTLPVMNSNTLNSLYTSTPSSMGMWSIQKSDAVLKFFTDFFTRFYDGISHITLWQSQRTLRTHAFPPGPLKSIILF